MAMTVPEVWTVLKPFTIGDKSFENGDTLGTAELVTVPHLSALLSAGYVVPDADPFFRKTSVPAHIPTTLPPSALQTPAPAPVEKPAPAKAAAKPKSKSAKVPVQADGEDS